MSEVNPYEYLEETLDIPYASISGSEPQVPIQMSVTHKTGFFSSRLAEILVTEEHLEVISPGLDEPILIPRDSVKGRIKLRLLDMILIDDAGKKHRLIYPKKDPEKYLKLARLEAWFNIESPDPPEVQVLNGLKKWTPCMVKNWLAGLLVLQGIAMFSILIFFFMDTHREPVKVNADMAVFWGIVILILTCNLVPLILLYCRQIWVLNFVLVFYVLFLLLSLLGANLIGIIVACAMIYYTSAAKKDYAKLSLLVER